MTDTADSLTIRQATQRDMAVVAAMAEEFDAFLHAIDGSDPTFDAQAVEARLVRLGFGAKPLFCCLVAEAAGAPVGYAIFSIGFWADGYQGMVLLSDFFVREAWRSRGLGRRMMDRMAEIGRDANCEVVMSTVWTKNPQARRFYDRLGAIHIDDENLIKWPIRSAKK